MALSNKFGWLVLDDRQQVGDVGRLLDALRRHRRRLRASSRTCPKTLVYRACAAANAASGPADPEPDPGVDRRRARRRAELRPDQRDEDSLPPYDVLDPILEGYVEQDLGREQLIARGLAAADVDRVIRARRPRRVQAPPGAAGDQDHRAAPSAATAACRSPTATAAEPGSRLRPGAVGRASYSSRGARTAIVTRVIAQRRCSSSVHSTSHSHVVRPRWIGRAVAWIVPFSDRAQEARVVRQPHRLHALLPHADERSDRGERLGDRRVDAPVHEPERLQQLRAHRHLRVQGSVVVGGEVPHSDEAGEASVGSGERRGFHGAER